MSDTPAVSEQSSSPAEEPVAPQKKPLVRKRVLLIPFLVAALVPAAWGAVALAAPVLSGMQVKSDLAAAGEMVSGSKDEAGKYRPPATFDTDTIVSFAEVGAGHFCLSGTTLNDGYISDPKFYSSATGKVSSKPDDCLNLEGDANTYKCLPATMDYMRGSVSMINSPEYHEATIQSYKMLDRLKAEGASESRINAEFERSNATEVIQRELKRWEETTPELPESEAMATLAGLESGLREEVGMSTPEYAAQEESFRAYNDMAGNEANYDRNGDVLPEKKAEIDELYEKAIQSAENYYLGVMCS